MRYKALYNTYTSADLFAIILCAAISLFSPSCAKLIEIDAPITNITAGNVYATDATAIAVLTGIYSKWEMRPSLEALQPVQGAFH